MLDRIMELLAELATAGLALTGNAAAAAVVAEVKPVVLAAVVIVEQAANGEAISELLSDLVALIQTAQATVAQLEQPPAGA